MFSIACIGGKRGKRGQVLGQGRDPKMGQLTLGKEPAETGICNHVGEAAMSSNGFSLA
jgi:hypothetical protein